MYNPSQLPPQQKPRADATSCLCLESEKKIWVWFGLRNARKSDSVLPEGKIKYMSRKKIINKKTQFDSARVPNRRSEIWMRRITSRDFNACM